MDLVASQGMKVSRASVNLPTPTVADVFTANLASSQQSEGSMHSVSLAQAVVRPDLMPTPTTRDYKDGTAEHKRDGIVQTDTVARAVFNSGEVTMLPTPQVDDSKNTGHNQDRRTTLASEVWATQQTTNWGKFEPAIRRWEQTLGIPAPAPTKPDGKDGAHRLSSNFTEWMMGLEPGHITDCGLTRNEELKAAGNGVVPAQAILALKILLADVMLE
jgi:DNA (cytosine-5)-methyltransferase 1